MTSIVMANAGIFCSCKGIPCLDDDIIAIPTTTEEARFLRSILPGKACVNHSRTFYPEYYIILSGTLDPKYSTFPSTINNKTPIRLSLDLQRRLKSMVYDQPNEYSGIITSEGIITNLLEGQPNGAPMQKDVEGCITFHTHPIMSYAKYGTNIGWPSPADIHSNEKHLVSSAEGIYLVLKSTCTPPQKKGTNFEVEEVLDILKRCSWLLLPWDRVWYVFGV